MPHRRRDPETGRFLPGRDGPEFDRLEEIQNSPLLSVAAADLDGTTGQLFGEDAIFEGVELYEVDQVLDRDELAVMLWAEHHLTAYFASTATADSTIRATVEVSTSPARALANELDQDDAIADQEGDFTIDADVPERDPEADVVGRVLSAVGYGPITDGTNGVGGAGTAGTDWWQGQPAAAPGFDARDDLFLNGVIQISNASDLSAHVDVDVRHVYGIIEDFFD